MTERTAHTVHVLSIYQGLGDAVSRSLPEITVVSVLTYGFGMKDLSANMTRQLTEAELAPLKKAEILLCDTKLLSQVLSRKGVNFLERLRWVQVTRSGIDEVIKVLGPGIKPPFILTRSTSDALALLMAEYVVGQIVCRERDWINTHLKQMSKDYSRWHELHQYRSLGQLTVGLMGLGKVGFPTAKALKRFGCRVHGFTRTPRSRASMESCVDQLWHGQEGLTDFLDDCDYLVNLLPSTPLTRGMLGGAVLSGAHKKPVLVNVGRGDIICEADLLTGLEKGWLSAAVLDCFEKEPVPEDSLLWTHPKVVMTPHNSCINNEDYKCHSVVRDFSANFADFVAGRPLTGQVDWQAGY